MEHPQRVNKLLLNDIPRGQWGFDGFIVCDLGGIGHLIDGHHITDDKVVAVAHALNAGCDYDDAEYRINIPKAVERKLGERGDGQSFTRQGTKSGVSAWRVRSAGECAIH